MTLWATAMLVWIAAGARVGRVLVKPATTARVAIVVAVSAVAAAATLSIAEVAVAVDAAWPDGVRSGALSEGLVTAAWLLFATATSVVAAAAWPVVSRVNLHRIALFGYAGGASAMAATVVWSFDIGRAVTALACVFIVTTGARSLDWTALGRGIAVYTAGTALVGVLSVWEIRRSSPGPGFGALTPGWVVASGLVAAGAVWIVVELWVRARLLMHRVGPLHRVLVERFPEVAAHGQPGTSTLLTASDRVAQIMDALYMQSGSGVESVAVGVPPVAVRERAALVAQWVRNPLGDIVIDARWVAPPDGVGTRGWVGAIARAFRTGVSAEKSAAR
ncbi:hypothetical protein ACWEKT_17550 [Nocardia takedensis]